MIPDRIHFPAVRFPISSRASFQLRYYVMAMPSPLSTADEQLRAGIIPPNVLDEWIQAIAWSYSPW